MVGETELLMTNDSQPSDVISPYLSVNIVKADMRCVLYRIFPPVHSANTLCGGYLLQSQSSATLNTFVLPECFI